MLKASVAPSKNLAKDTALQPEQQILKTRMMIRAYNLQKIGYGQRL